MKRLYFLHVDGCPACNKMKPIMKKVAEARPDVEVKAIDLSQVNWTLESWQPRVTPTLVIIDRFGAQPRAAEGYAPLKTVLGWIDLVK